ncbi:MAG: hypothetical protein J2P46_15980 [Zavarzinella sp.]|nr:hypothetical protein [Zavarzinella sp.]
MPGERQGVPLDPLEQRLGQDQLVAGDGREAVELDLEPAVAVLLQGQGVPAECLPVPGQPAEPAAELLGLVPVRGHHLDAQVRLPGPLGRGQEDGERIVTVADQVQGVLRAGEVPVAGQRDVGVLHRPGVEVLGGRRAGQPGQARRGVRLQDYHADHVGPAGRLPEQLSES